MKKRINISNSSLKKIINESINEVLNDDEIFDLKSISDDELESQMVDYALASGFGKFDSPLFKNPKTDEYLTESANGFSYPLVDVKNIISERYDMKDWQFKIYNRRNKIDIALLIYDISKNVEMIKSDMEQLGYFNSVEKNMEPPYENWVTMQFEPEYEDDVNNFVRSRQVLIHVTPEHNVEGIKRNGLIPSNKNKFFKYPNRIYFFEGDTPQVELINMVKQLSAVNSVSSDDKNYFLIIVELNKVPREVNFYFDTNCDYGIYCNEPISLDAIISYLPVYFK